MRFLAWYRRFYLLVNVPILLALTELLLVHFDIAHRPAFAGPPLNDPDDLANAFARFDASPPGDAPYILILGNSATRAGIDQALVEQGISTPAHPWRAYNFGLKAVRVDDERELMQLLLDRGMKPKAVVLGVNPFLVDHKVNPDSLYPWLSRTSPYLMFHRSRIRKTLRRAVSGFIESHLGSKSKGDKRATRDARSLQFIDNSQMSPEERRKDLEKDVEKVLGEFESRPPEDFPLLDQLPELDHWLADKGIPMFVVLMPMNPAATTKLPAFEPLMAKIRATAPPGSLDASTGFTVEEFIDTGHPDEAGRLKLTAQIVDWLRTKPELVR